MKAQDELDGLRGLHQDLIALSESRLASVEKLWIDLEAHIEAFRKLLDKPPKNNASRQKLSTGEIRSALHSALTRRSRY